MKFEKFSHRNGSVAAVTSLTSPIADAGDFLDVIASGASDVLVIDAAHFLPEIFDLKTRILGEILQKVSNYRKKLVICGDWPSYPGKALGDFIRESNAGGQVVFSADADSGLELLR